MRILIEVTHPAHVHFYRNPINILKERGHKILITSRNKDCTLELLDRYGISHHCISEQNSGSAAGMARELIYRNSALLRIASKFKPAILTGIGGISAAQVGLVLRTPSVIFYDTETARLQNLMTYPFSTRIVVPKCYKGKLPARKAVRYRGYHELSYLHPNYFTPRQDIALENGLAPKGDTFLLRIVSWKASHDIGLKGWSLEVLDAVVEHLREHGSVIISAEGKLPEHLEPLRYTGDSSEIHHLIAYCRACIGESATMASEAVTLGVPAVYAATESRGYIDEQASRYQMVRIAPAVNPDAILTAINEMLTIPVTEVKRRHRLLLEDTVDVAELVVSQLNETGGIH